MNQIQDLKDHVAPIRDQLIDHPLYGVISSVDQLRVFAEHHVFAVWDFMSLLKALQNGVTCTNVPWMPSLFREESRLINEIVLDEESDVDEDGSVMSHFEMYVHAMERFGANPAAVSFLIGHLRSGWELEEALDRSGVIGARAEFVRSTFRIIETGELSSIASAFTFGREDLLPDVFTQVVQELNRDQRGELEGFLYYLHRHIELDGGEHGHRAEALVERLCGADQRAWELAAAAAEDSLNARLNLWNAIHQEIVESGNLASI